MRQLRCTSTSLTGVKLIELDSFEDHRGEYVETYNQTRYRSAGIEVDFLVDDYSWSTNGVLRGIHGDDRTWKLVSCPYGRLYLVVVNCDQGGDDFGKWESFVLSDLNHRQVLVPPSFGNGHLVLSDVAIFSYKQSAYYEPTSQFTYRWDDPRFGIFWPVDRPMLSRRDADAALSLSQPVAQTGGQQ